MSKRPSLKALDRRPAFPAVTVPASEQNEQSATPGAVKQQPSRVGKKVVTVYLPESVWRDLKVLAAKTDTTIDALMRRGLDHVFAEHGINRGAAEGLEDH
jgi:hypothetical protein